MKIIDLSNVKTKEMIAKQIILSATGFFSVACLTKKYPSPSNPRVFNCRLGVTKFLRGGKSTTKNKPNLMTVWDKKVNDYRTIDLSNVLWVQVNGRKYSV